jgi:hypothetical protein
MNLFDAAPTGVNPGIWSKKTTAIHCIDSHITAFAGIHLCATIPDFLAFEYHSDNIPLWSTMLDLKNPIREGTLLSRMGRGWA